MFILLKFVQGHVKIRVVGKVSTSHSMYMNMVPNWAFPLDSMSNKLICCIVCFCDGSRRDPSPQSDSTTLRIDRELSRAVLLLSSITKQWLTLTFEDCNS